jgi:hypothetical protein
MRKASQLPLFTWAKPYRKGTRVGRVQALTAYADYYGLSGIADDLDDEEYERLPLHRPPMQAYASHTGTRRNLSAMREASWRLILSPAGTLTTQSMKYGLDNGAWSAFQQGRPFNDLAFMRAVEKVGEGADWIVLPDIVAGGMRSLDLSLAWMDRLRGLPTPLLIAVQNGMELDDVRRHLSPSIGIFIGGDTAWKESTAIAWGQLARRRNCYLHVGRVNTARRIAICAAAGANSYDGSSVTRFAKTLPPLDKATRQPDLFAAANEWTNQLCAALAA